jgi:hypothetical protein
MNKNIKNYMKKYQKVKNYYIFEILDLYLEF